MKISIEEKDESQTYRPVPVEQFLQMIKDFDDRIEIKTPNLCGGETKITIYKSAENGHPGNINILSGLYT